MKSSLKDAWKSCCIFDMNGYLLFKVFERIERMNSIKVFVIIAMTAFNFAVMPRSIWFDELVEDVILFERTPKQRDICIVRASHALCKLGAVVCLDAFDLDAKISKVTYDMSQKLGRAVSVMFLECF